MKAPPPPLNELSPDPLEGFELIGDAVDEPTSPPIRAAYHLTRLATLAKGECVYDGRKPFDMTCTQSHSCVTWQRRTFATAFY